MQGKKNTKPLTTKPPKFNIDKIVKEELKDARFKTFYAYDCLEHIMTSPFLDRVINDEQYQLLQDSAMLCLHIHRDIRDYTEQGKKNLTEKIPEVRKSKQMKISK